MNMPADAVNPESDDEFAGDAPPLAGVTDFWGRGGPSARETERLMAAERLAHPLIPVHNDAIGYRPYEADDEFSYREEAPMLDGWVRRDPIRFLRNPVIPLPCTYNDATRFYNTALAGRLVPNTEQVRHRLEDVAATFGVDLDEPRVTSDPVDHVNHPSHYTSSAAKCPGCGRGIECIEVIEGMSLCLGNAIKYLWRAGLKGDTIEDLKKSVWYIQREIGRLSS